MSRTVTLYTNDVIKWAETYDGPPFHAFLCDPPYHLNSIVKRYGSPDAAPNAPGVYNRSSKGFMGKQWDGGDVAFRPETWAAILKHLHPGAFSFAFASTRGFHRMAVAMEDAGFIIHPAIMAWGFGSGFPKGTRIDTQIDKAAGATRKKVKLDAKDVRNQKSIKGGEDVDGGDRPFMIKAREEGFYMADAGEAVTEDAKKWIDYRYGGQALKPALEPIVCIQKPYPPRTGKNGKKTWQSINETGAGALNIGGAQVVSDVEGIPGRYPPGLALVHHPNCKPGLCVDDCPVRAVHLQGGTGHSSRVRKVTNRSTNRDSNIQFNFGKGGGVYAGDSGAADRYFPRVDWQMERDEAEACFDPVLYALQAAAALNYVPKPTTQERSAGIKGGKQRRSDARPDSPDETGKFPDHDARESENPHPTVKPMALTKWLATLLLPPPAYHRRLLVPFAGVGSEVIGAYAAGWDDIVGVELTDEYAAVARQRLDHWMPILDARRAAELLKPAPLPLQFVTPPAQQMDFFMMLDSMIGGG